MKRVVGNFAKPADHAKLCLRDGGGLPGAAPGPLSQGPMSPQFWSAMGQGVHDTVEPIVAPVRQFNEDYPAVAQVAQLAAQPVNTAVGVYGAGKGLIEGNYPEAAASALGAIPVLGKFAKSSFLAGTKRSVQQFKQINAMGMRPSRDMVATAFGRVAPDAGAAIQAKELGVAAHDTTTTLRGEPPGPFYGGN